VLPVLGAALAVGTLLVSPVLAAGSRATLGAGESAVVQVRFPDWETRDAFLAAHPETEMRTDRAILGPELVVTAQGLADLEAGGVPYHWVETVPVEGSPLRAQNTTHYTYQETVDSLTAFAARFPAITDLSVLGVSRDGYDIHALKVSDNVGTNEDEPGVVLVGVHHGGEAAGVDCLMYLLRELLGGYGSDPGYTAYVNDLELWVVPILNPDGWMVNESGITTGWRKNTRDNNSSGAFETYADGVDLNRNYGYHWGMSGSSNPSNSLYYGPYGFSEPELLPFRDLILAERPTLALTYHQSGDVIIIPWRWSGQPTPDYPTYRNMASALASRIQKTTGGAYGWYEASDTGGYMDDWMYGVLGGFCFTVEVTTGTYGPNITLAAQNNLPGALWALDRVQGNQVTGLVTSAQSGLPVEAEIEILEVDTSALEPRMTDPATGRYRRLINAGSYTLMVQADGYVSQTIPFSVSGGVPTVIDVALQSGVITNAGAPAAASGLALAQAQPNPANPSASIRFRLPETAPARLELFDASGRLVRTLFEGVGAEGWSEVRWDGADEAGRPAASGVYLYRLVQGSRVETRRLVLLR
jgi:hypothetical protein